MKGVSRILTQAMLYKPDKKGGNFPVDPAEKPA